MTTVLVTACGCPGASTLIFMLKKEGVKVIGCDMDENAIGRFLADEFYTVPESKHPNYVGALLEIATKEHVDVVLPESSLDIPILVRPIVQRAFRELGIEVMISSNPSAVWKASNKYLMYEDLKSVIELPEYYYPRTLDEFVKNAENLGYPEKPFVFKPHVAKGSRGFRIVDNKADRIDMLLNQKPVSKYISMEEFIHIFKDHKELPPILIMEYLESPEYTVDALCKDGEILLASVKSVDRVRGGVIVEGKIHDKPDLMEQAEKIVKKFKFDYHVNIQFRRDKLMEINPRVSTFMYQPDLNMPYLGVQLAQGFMDKKEIMKYQKRVRIGWSMIRYMDQMFFLDKEVFAIGRCFCGNNTCS